MPDTSKAFKKESITVAFMVEHLRTAAGIDIESVNDVSGEDRLVTEVDLHRPGLVLAGYTDLFTHQRVQILGNTENRFLQHQPVAARRKAFETLVSFPVPCIVLTVNNELDDEMVDMATRQGVPVFRTPLQSIDFMAISRDFLNDQFALQQTIHGSLVAVYGIGLLLVGKSGIGKSEVALDLVERGHRLVADDVVIVTRKEEQVLMGAGTDLAQHFMEVRGLGLVDIRAMFGIRAIRFRKRVEIVVHMELWDTEEEYTRLGMVSDTFSVLDVELPMVKIPITPGKNITVICEVIAMNHLLRNAGYDPAEVFAKRLADRIRSKGSDKPARMIEYFQHDYE